MMKREYVRPTAVVETFAANEYVAGCAMNYKHEYIFKCDAPAGKMYVEHNGADYYVNRSSGYHPCSKTHVTSSTAGYYDGWIDYNSNDKKDSGETALIWLEGNPNWSNGSWPNYEKNVSVSNAHGSASLTRNDIELGKQNS